MQRRSLLKLGALGGVALALVGGGAAFYYEPGWRNGRLTEAGRSVMAAIARAVLDGSLPKQAGLQQAALASHLDRMDVTLRALAPSTQGEVGDLLALLAFAPGRLALGGLGSAWPNASVEQIQAALQSMRTSRISLRQQAFHALRDLTHAAYFADVSTWVQLGYPGPLKVE
jgi:hypothetical protein